VSQKRAGGALCGQLPGEFFGHTPALLQKDSLIAKRKVELLDGLISVRKKCLQQAETCSYGWGFFG
jgi:hypothetical protein